MGRKEPLFGKLKQIISCYANVRAKRAYCRKLAYTNKPINLKYFLNLLEGRFNKKTVECLGLNTRLKVFIHYMLSYHELSHHLA